MKRAIVPALLVAMLLAVPAIPQGGTGGADLSAQVEELKARVAQQEQRLEQLESYVEQSKLASATLVQRLKTADKQGFLYPAPNTDARKALLHGLRDFAETAAAGTKAPARLDEEE